MAMRAMFPALAALLSFASGAGAQSPPPTMFFAVLNGGNVCDKSFVLICGEGDPDGVGSATVTIISETRLCFGLVVDNIGTPTAARIHAGPAAVNGPVVVTLPVPVGGNPGTASGCVTVASEVLAAIRLSPQNFYINIRNSSFSSGAVRGQLF
ncbi:MAG: CHRD domain-containing protein [Hyphomicrobiales bacterium]